MSTINVSESKNVVTTKNGLVVSENVSKEVKKSLDKKEAKSKKAKSVKTEKAESLNFLSMLNSIDKSILKTNAGLSKENIYKNEVYADCIMDASKKVIRRKIRNFLESFIESALSAKSDKNKLAAIKKQFDIFYKATYRVNDYSISSLISNNTNDTKKQNIQKMLDAFKGLK